MPINQDGVDIPASVLHYQNRTKGKPFRTLADENNLTVGQVAGAINRYNPDTIKEDKVEEELFHVDIGKPFELEGDFIIVGDVHVPTCDLEFAHLPAAIAEKYGIENLLVSGDLYNMDHFSSYPKSVGSIIWHQEKRAARALMKRWSKIFKNVFITMGNHEERKERRSDGAEDHTDIFGDLLDAGNVKTSGFGWSTIETVTGTWRSTHPNRNYSVNQLTVGDIFAQKYHSHMIVHHEHHLAKGWDRYKRYIVVNNGGLFDVNKMEYVQRFDSKSAGMAKGFSMLKDGHITLYGEYPFTNWSEVLG